MAADLDSSLDGRAQPAFRLITAAIGHGVDHSDVAERVLQAGRIGASYLLMTAISAAIAILGLLLSSPAVVIGAMLVSPLMGPILLLGFSFCTVDWAATRKALASLGAGFGLALVVSVALTAMSPLKEPTAEILARAHPTLFDLLVAVFSGIAGAFAVIRHRGETVIGVAIATALMPPLAVVGFGAGTGAWAIAGGALLLFFTNLLAIALAAAVMAALSGFRPEVHLARRGWIAHAAVLLILTAMCVPLTLGLRTIAQEGRANAEARAEVSRLFGPKSRLATLNVRGGQDGLEVDGLVATQAFVPDAQARMAEDLKAKLRLPVTLVLDQVVLADPSKLKPQAAPVPGKPAADPVIDAAKALRAAVPFTDATTSYDPASGAGTVLLGAESALDLAGARALEDGLRRQAGAKTSVIPPLRPLPPLPLATSGGGAAKLVATDLQAWALARWRAASVDARICGGGRRGVRTRELTAVLEAAFTPLPVRVGGADAPACPKGTSAAVLIAPGPRPSPSAAAGPQPTPAAPPSR